MALLDQLAFFGAAGLTGSSLSLEPASFLGGIRSLTMSSPLASAKEVILWLGEKPCRAEERKDHQHSLFRPTYTYASCHNMMKKSFVSFLPLLSDALPPERAPKGRAPVGVRPFSCSTDSDSSLQGK